MKIFYSASLAGFFSPDVHETLPGDAVAVTPRRHAALLAAQEQGAQIVAGKDGKPALLHPDRSPAARRAELSRAIRREASRRIAAISPTWRQLNDLRSPSEAGSARFAAIDTIRAASNVLEAALAAIPAASLDNFPVADNPLWPTDREESRR